MKELLPTKDACDLIHQGSLALAIAESNGIRLDVEYLDRTVESLGGRIKKLEGKLRTDEAFAVWRKRWGIKTNLGSKEQLAEVVFGQLGYRCMAWTSGGTTGKKKRPKASEDAFADVDLPFVKRYFRWWKFKGLRTRLISLKKESVDGYFHPNFNLHSARTFRSSSGADKEMDSAGASFNFQNIYSRDPKMAEIVRRSFVARPGRRLVESDFAAQEFKGGAIQWSDPELIKYASDLKKDIHRDVAARCYLLEKGQVSKQIRYCGKNGFVFPKQYGSYHKKIARAMWDMIDQHGLETEGVSLKEHLKSKGIDRLGACENGSEPAPGTFEHHIKKVEDWYERLFAVFTAKRDPWYNEYRRNGGFMTLTGFPVKGLYSKNDTLNYPIQAMGFHFLLKTLILLQEWIDENGTKALILGQIHDCILADVPDDELQDYLDEIARIVEVELKKHWPWICVPLAIEAECSPVDGNWWQKEPWEKRGGVWAPKATVTTPHA